MSYMRSPHYVFSCACPGPDGEGGDHISIDMAVEMPTEHFDELVVMRAAELTEEGLLEAAERRAVERYNGNVGCDALSRKLGKPEAFGPEFRAILDEIKRRRDADLDAIQQARAAQDEADHGSV